MRKVIEAFIAWTKLKITIHLSEREIYFREGEIWWASLGVNIGYEQNGKHANFERPVLILRKLNRHVLWVIPLSTKLKEHSYYYQYTYKRREYSAILIQLRAVSSKRLLRKVGVLPKDSFCELRGVIQKMI
jgi:mRNA interferase MazF